MGDLALVRQVLRSVAVTIVTVFDDEAHEIDTDAIVDNARYIVKRGIRLLIPCGNTGEFHSITNREWEAITRSVASAIGTRAVVMPAVGGPLPDALHCARVAEAAGAQAIMVMPLHHTYTSRSGAAAYLDAIASAVSIGVVAYVRNEALAEGDIVELGRARPNIVGVKWAIPDASRFANTQSLPGSEALEWSCGIAELWAPALFAGGAVGFTSGLASFAPRSALKMHSALASGDYKGAAALRAVMAPFEQFRARHNSAYNVPAIKHAMSRIGLRSGSVRPPLSPVAIDEIPALDRAIEPLVALEESLAATPE